LSDKSNTGLVSLDHPFKVPIWTRVVRENAEIVILGIDVRVVFGVQDNVGADIAIDTIAESADLPIKKLILRFGNMKMIYKYLNRENTIERLATIFQNRLDRHRCDRVNLPRPRDPL